MNPQINKALAAAEALRSQRFADARAFFLAGSIVRGEGTRYSDLDVVVVYDDLPAASRESFLYEAWPVEVFIHDCATLRYFFHEVDRPSGIPSLPEMVSQGIPLPHSTRFSASLKREAEALLAEGPPVWDDATREASRYQITALVDDLRDPRSHAEVTATGAELYAALANHYFRSRRMWSASGKAIPRRLAQASPSLAQDYECCFAQLFEQGQCEAVVALAKDLLKPDGGLLFDSYRSTAPSNWRSDPGDG